MTLAEFLTDLIGKILARVPVAESGIDRHDALSRWLAKEIAVYIASQNVRWRETLRALRVTITPEIPPVLYSVRLQQRWNPPQSRFQRVEVEFSVAPNQPRRRIRVSLWEFQNDSFRLIISVEGSYGFVFGHSKFGRFERLVNGRIRVVEIAPLPQRSVTA